MQYKSRFTRIQEEKSSKKLILSIATAGIILVIAGVWGVPFLINMSTFIGGIGRAKETPTPTPSSYLFAPNLDTTYEATNSVPIKLTGTSSSDGKIELYLNGDLYDTTEASQDGTFTFKQVILKSGPNKLWSKVISGNNKSDNSEPITISYSKEKPKLDLSKPEEGSTVKNEQKQVLIEGATESGNNITINDHFVVVDQDGKFSYTMPANDGDITIKVVATDKAGNSTTLERKFKFTSS